MSSARTSSAAVGDGLGAVDRDERADARGPRRRARATGSWCPGRLTSPVTDSSFTPSSSSSRLVRSSRKSSPTGMKRTSTPVASRKLEPRHDVGVVLHLGHQYHVASHPGWRRPRSLASRLMDSVVFLVKTTSLAPPGALMKRRHRRARTFVGLGRLVGGLVDRRGARWRGAVRSSGSSRRSRRAAVVSSRRSRGR